VNNIGTRIERLEKHTGDAKDTVWLIAVYDDGGKTSEAVIEKAKTEYKATHPDWQEQDYNVIWVTNEETKQGVERIMAGERTE